MDTQIASAKNEELKQPVSMRKYKFKYRQFVLESPLPASCLVVLVIIGYLLGVNGYLGLESSILKYSL